MQFLLVIESPKTFITTMTFEIAIVSVGTSTFYKCSIVISTIRGTTDLLYDFAIVSCSTDHASS